MGIMRQFDESDDTVQFLHKGWTVTPKMKKDDPEALLKGLGDALNEAYNKLRDANVE